MKRLWLIVLAAGLSGCANHVAAPSDPVVQVKEVKVAQPVPCPELAALGAEPTYPDTDAALAASPDIFTSTKLLLAGRVMRTKRLMAFAAAAAACSF